MNIYRKMSRLCDTEPSQMAGSGSRSGACSGSGRCGRSCSTSSCSDLQSKTSQPAINAIFRPELCATERRSNRNYLQLNLQSNAPNLQSSELNRHYLQLKIWTWTGAENDRLLDAIPVAIRSTSGMACRHPEIQSRKQRPASA